MRVIITEEQLNHLINEQSTTEIIAYHGSNARINAFVTDFISGPKSNDSEGPGIYFTTSKEEAMQYGSVLYTVKLSPRILLSSDNKRGVTRASIMKLIKMYPDWKMDAYDWDENAYVGLKKSLDAIFDHDNAKDIITQVYINHYNHKPKEYVSNATALGYDGIIVSTDWGSKMIIVYNPKIIEILKVENIQDL